MGRTHGAAPHQSYGARDARPELQGALSFLAPLMSEDPEFAVISAVERRAEIIASIQAETGRRGNDPTARARFLCPCS